MNSLPAHFHSRGKPLAGYDQVLTLGAHFEKAHDLPNQVNRACNDNNRLRTRSLPGAIQSRRDLCDRLDLGARTTASLLNLVRRRRPWILGPRGNDALGQGKQDLRHL